MASPFESHIEATLISGRCLGEDFFRGGAPGFLRLRWYPFIKEL